MRFDKTILVVGFGSIGKRHTKNILEHTNSKIIILTKQKSIVNDEIQTYFRNKDRINISSNLKSCLKYNPKIAFITNETSLHIDFAIKLDMQWCFRCGAEIETLRDFSLDHKIPWLHNKEPKKFAS